LPSSTWRIPYHVRAPYSPQPPPPRQHREPHEALRHHGHHTARRDTASAQPVQITISQPAEATTMDPGRSTQVLTVNYFYNLYDTLTRWDNSLRLQPALATSWKNVNETTWEFTIRQGVKFHDGAPLTVEDVKATLERNLVPGKTVVQPGFATIEAVQVVNPTTIRVSTKRPDPLLLVRMAQMGSQILPARLTTDDGVKELARRPVGTGAYRFVEWVKDERLVMEANREWWGWEGKAPPIDRVVWKPIPEDFRGSSPREGRGRHHHERAARSHQEYCRRPRDADPQRPVEPHRHPFHQQYPAAARR
jgi:ABC-type transport system substrate-binding protein